MDNIILLGGIHGVGKTTTGEYIAEQTGLKFISAGEILINSTIVKENTGKGVSNIEDIQDLLILRLRDIIRPGAFYLLDGHFCLIDESGQIRKVPLNIFQEISPIAIIILKDAPSNIKEKIKNRNGLDFTTGFLDTMQREEESYGLEISSLLGISCYITNLAESAELISTIKNIIQKKSTQTN
nr:ATP-binding protein [Parabacteroides goldsteinii]